MSKTLFSDFNKSDQSQGNALRQFMSPGRSATQSNYRTGSAQSGGGNRPASPMAGQTTQYANTSGQSVQPSPTKSPPSAMPSVPGVASSARGAGMVGNLQDLLGTPKQQSGFDLNPSQNYAGGTATGGAYVRPPYAPRLFANSPVLRFGGDSVDSSVPPSPPYFVSQKTENSFADFNAEAQRLASQPRESLYKITSDRVTENMQNASQQGIADANKSVNDRLQARQGYYPTPGQRSSGFYARGMGPMAGDAELIERQNRPLGDGGPAAAAAKADQERRRIEGAAAMAESGQPSDGMTRYMPNQDLLAFANAYRQQEDQKKFSALQEAGLFPNPASGSNGDQAYFGRPALSAMTPDEIGFYRHKMNMITNPAYRDRVEAKRADREEMLGNRRAMASARRQGALEAAGASQQLRNFMAGRGALGAGRDGFGALMSLAASQNPNRAFGDYGQAYNALTAPDMQEQRMVTGFEQRKELNELDARLKRDADTRKMQMDILADPDIPGHQKPKLMQAAADPTKIGSPELASLMRPPFIRDTSKTKVDNFRAAQQYFATHNVPPEEQQAILQQNDLVLSSDEREEALDGMNPIADFRGIDGINGTIIPITTDPAINYATNFILRLIGQDPESLEKKNKLRESLLPSQPTTTVQ